MWMKLKDGTLLNLDNVARFYIMHWKEPQGFWKESKDVWRPMAQTLTEYYSEVKLAGDFSTQAEAQAVIDKIEKTLDDCNYIRNVKL
jgi:hypothetical protein